MQVEIVKYYPVKKLKGEYHGMLHVFLPELGVDIKGIIAIKKVKRSWNFYLPSRKGKYMDNSMDVRFNTFSFRDPLKNKELLKEISRKGRAFILNYVSNERSSDDRNKNNVESPKAGKIRPWSMDKRTRPSGFRPFRDTMPNPPSSAKWSPSRDMPHSKKSFME